MKILALSDLNWNIESKSVSVKKMMKINTSKLLECRDFYSLRFYFDIIQKHKPDLLLLCGDITGDGSCGHGYVSIVIALFRLLDERKIKTRFISGNHDEPKYYDEVLKYCHKLTYIKELTDIAESINGVKFMGLNFQQTRTRMNIRNHLFATADFLVTHCTHTNRLCLFDFNVKFIITGHYDMKVINPNKKTLISMTNDSPEVNYVVIDHENKKQVIDFYYNNWSKRMSGDKSLMHLKFVKTRKSFRLVFKKADDRVKFIHNKPLEKAMSRLIFAGNRPNIEISESEFRQMRQIKVNENIKMSDKFISGFSFRRSFRY